MTKLSGPDPSHCSTVTENAYFVCHLAPFLLLALRLP